MKKLLEILVSFTLVASIARTIVSCADNNNTNNNATITKASIDKSGKVVSLNLKNGQIFTKNLLFFKMNGVFFPQEGITVTYNKTNNTVLQFFPMLCKKY